MQNIFWSREQDRGWEGGGGKEDVLWEMCKYMANEAFKGVLSHHRVAQEDG